MKKEVASIIKFILDSAGNPIPYYHNMPENFVVPSVYFPSPEITFEPDTFSTYGADYNIFVNFFHSSTELAFMSLHCLCFTVSTLLVSLSPRLTLTEKPQGNI